MPGSVRTITCANHKMRDLEQHKEEDHVIKTEETRSDGEEKDQQEVTMSKKREES